MYSLLTDEYLLDKFLNQKSTKIKINNIKKILKKNGIDDIKTDNISNEIILDLIPSGTKGVIRGLEFNKIIKNIITDLKILPDIEIEFEKKVNHFLCDDDKSIIKEIPDFYIYNKNNKKLLIGFNQIDLWTGGHQINRGYKYVMDENIHKNKNIKIICVICKSIKLKGKNKVFDLLKYGLEKQRILYTSQLPKIIEEFIY